MRKIRIGILSPSDIATRRFLPALPPETEFVGIAVASKKEWFGDIDDSAFNSLNEREIQKANGIISTFGGKLFYSYSSLISSGEIDAIYIPLPPALHYQWGKIALENGLHVLLEKPLTTSYNESKDLVDIAKRNGLLVYENYAFEFHNQIEEIKRIIDSGVLGDLRLIRTSFGFPYRGQNDFRYNKALGGGALNDCGGYPIKLATIVLGGQSKIVFSKLGYINNHDVDVFGFAVLENKKGESAIASFGMDNTYKCELEVWGSKSTLYCPRVFTPPADFKSKILITGETNKEIEINEDDYFKNSILRFISYLNGDKEDVYQQILLQDCLMEEVRKNNEKQ